MGLFDFLFRKKSIKTHTIDNSVPIDNSESGSKNDDSLFALSAEEKNEIINRETIKAKNRSESFYKKHIENIGDINVDVAKVPSEPLNPEELSFLRYIHGKAPKSVAGYWTHEVNLNIKKTIEKFISMEYIYYGINPLTMTMNDLKDLLKNKNLIQSGKKIELVNRVNDNFTVDELSGLGLDKSLLLTESGKKTLNEIPISITHNHIRDRKIINMIMNGDFENAYNEVCLYEVTKPTQRGIGINWSDDSNYHQNWINDKIPAYNEILNGEYRDDDSNKHFASIMIFLDMLGKNLWDISKKSLRELVPYNSNKELTLAEISNIDQTSIQKISSILHKHNTLADLKSYNNYGIELYKISTANNETVCPVCRKISKKIFKVSDAIIGKNAPPLCESCRCTTVPYFDDDIQLEMEMNVKAIQKRLK